MILIEYPKCSTCQKAKKYLEANSFPFETRDIVLNPPSKEELEDYLKKSHKDIHTLFNTSGMKYRQLDLKNKLPKMTESDQLKLLASDGMLIKRPLLVTENKVWIGFKEKEWSELNENNKM